MMQTQKIMVFINTCEPLSAIPYSPTDPWSKQQIDKFLPPLFGFPDPMRVDGVVVDYNQGGCMCVCVCVCVYLCVVLCVLCVVCCVCVCVLRIQLRTVFKQKKMFISLL